MTPERLFIDKLEVIKPGLITFAHSLLGDRHSAEDALQEAMMKMLKHREKFKTGKLQYWASAILRNHCIDIIRLKRKLKLCMYPITMIIPWFQRRMAKIQ